MSTLKPNHTLQGKKYKVVKVLGQGGFGITYLAKQSVSVEGPLGRINAEIEVTIKEFFMKDLCNRDDATSVVSVPSIGSVELVEKFLQKFIKEAQNISKLNHPNIIKVLDVFEENGTAYYVMEYINGGSLGELIRHRGKLSESDSLYFTKKIASALQYIHSMNMNHLDVKPANVLLRQDGNVVLIDFGLSKNYDTTGEQTTSTPVGISVGYAPIEQSRVGGVGMFSPATDIYSLGATMFKMLTGETPPEASVIFDDGLPDLPSTISDTVKSVITKSMAPRRKERYQTIEALLAALDDSSNEQDTRKDFVFPKLPEETQPLLQEEKSSESVSEPKFLKEVDKEATMIISDFVVKKSIIETGEAVDLGLSVKWCSHNLGASKPEEPGKYFSWGASIENFTALPDSVEGTKDDNAFIQTNGKWRTPTRRQLKELMDKCRWSWMEYNGVAGCKVTGPSGKSIFLPAVGKVNNTNVFRKGEIGYYWSASKAQKYNTAHYLYFNSEDSELAYEPIVTKRSIRPVCD